jgi:hypothetical protein
MNFKFLLPVVLAGSFGVATAATALTITEEAGSNLQSFSYVIDADTLTIDLFEVWGPGTSADVVLKFDGWSYGSRSWTVNKYVTNETGSEWMSFSNELLDADQAGSDDQDGLSFAQLGVPLRPRSSDVFASVVADELDTRDFLLFGDGDVASGQSVFMTFGLTARRGGDDDNVNPFYLRQSETLAGVPEPATWAMLISGFGMVGFAMRRRRTTPVSVLA